jgi:hypothetical protein
MENVLSILSPEEVGSLGGLPDEAIAGTIVGDVPAPETFQPNPRFIEFMHQVIRTAAPADPDFRAAARMQGNGWVYIIDLRTPDGPQGRVPPEDIIGAFQVQNGEVLPDTYWPNEQHRVLTSSGLVSLPPSFRAAFVEQLSKVRAARAEVLGVRPAWRTDGMN